MATPSLPPRPASAPSRAALPAQSGATSQGPCPVCDPATEFVSLASSLSDRLVALEKYLASRPATVPAGVKFYPYSDEYEQLLQWGRFRGTWHLCVDDVPSPLDLMQSADDDGNAETRTQARLLTQCSVEVKLAAAEAIPSLLQQIKKGELRMIERLKVAHAQLDNLAIERWEGA